MLDVLQRTACLCGKTEATSFGKKDDIELIQCSCGIVRVADLDPQDYISQYMNGFYHLENNATVVDAVIADRITHDVGIAKQRPAELSILMNELVRAGIAVPIIDTVMLDVGCGNGAMVRAALDAGWDAYGIDMYLPETALTAYRAWRMQDRLDCCEISDCRFTRRTVDVIMMNDVIEHVLEPVKFLEYAAGVCKRNGLIVVDTPDFSELFIDNHHVKPKEHIWYLKPEEWREIFNRAGLTVLATRRPIEGKIVFYLQPDGRTLDVIIRGPTGLGDVHWILLKMRSLRALEEPCRLTLAIPGNGDPQLIFRSKGFLDMLPFIDESKLEIGPPVIVDSWCDDVRYPIYQWIANGYVERGLRIEDWQPHLPIDYDYPVVIPEDAQAWARTIKDQVNSRLVCLYASSRAWNHSVTAGKAWGVQDWADLVGILAAAGIKPVLVGKHWDQDYSGLLLQTIKAPYLDLTGHTSEAQVLALFKEAGAVIGMCAGITILAVHLRVPSIVFWPEVGKGSKETPMLFHKGFQTDWVDPEQLKSGIYAPLSLGAFGVQDVVAQLQKWGIL